MQRFLRDYDALGTSPKMNYKKSETFGTTLGGCCSVCANAGIAFYVVIALFAFITKPDYQFQSVQEFNSLKDAQEYALKPIDFLPAIYIEANDGSIMNDLY